MRYLSLLAVVAVVSAGQIAQAADQIPWMSNILEAQRIAQADGRLILVHFSGTNCPACVKVEHNVYSHGTVAQAITARYVPVKFDVEKNPDMAKRFGITQIPTDVILTSSWGFVEKTGCSQDPQVYVNKLSEIAMRAGSAPGTAIAGAPNYPQGAAQTPEGATPSPSAFGPPGPTPVGMQNHFAAQGPQQPYNPYAASPAADPNASRYGGEAYGPQAAPVASRYGDQYLPTGPTIAPPANDPRISSPVIENQFADGPPAVGGWEQGPAAVNNPYAQPAAPAVAEPPAAGSYAQAPIGPPSTAAPAGPAAVSPPRLPAGNPPLGLDGCCPVTLVEQTGWAQGDVKYGAVHRDRTYLFRGEAEQQRFLANPDFYSPVLSGYDAVAFVDRGEFVAGARKWGVFYKRQVYLFQDDKSLQQFWKNPDHYALAIYHAMTRGGTQRR